MKHSSFQPAIRAQQALDDLKDFISFLERKRYERLTGERPRLNQPYEFKWDAVGTILGFAEKVNGGTFLVTDSENPFRQSAASARKTSDSRIKQ